MTNRAIRRLAAGVVLSAWPVALQAAQPQPLTLALEGAYASLSAEWSEESPPGSELMHRGSVDAADTGFGLHLEYRFARNVGVRVGYLWSSAPISAETTCEELCTFSDGPIMVQISDVTWSVDQDADLTMFFLEVPLVAHPSDRVELFAGPSVAVVNLGDVRRGGLNGLAVEADVSTPSFGAHVGGTLLVGWKRRWTVGLIARWIPTDLELSVGQPLLGAAGDLLTVDRSEDLTTVSLLVGRRFGQRF